MIKELPDQEEMQFMSVLLRFVPFPPPNSFFGIKLKKRSETDVQFPPQKKNSSCSWPLHLSELLQKAPANCSLWFEFTTAGMTNGCHRLSTTALTATSAVKPLISFVRMAELSSNCSTCPHIPACNHISALSQLKRTTEGKKRGFEEGKNGHAADCHHAHEMCNVRSLRIQGKGRVITDPHNINYTRPRGVTLPVYWNRPLSPTGPGQRIRRSWGCQLGLRNFCS
jgi:hypothetical protein